MSGEIDPSVINFTDDHERAPKIIVKGETLTGSASTNHIGTEFVRVLQESGLARDETLSDYNRTSNKAATINPDSTYQRSQEETAQDARTLLLAAGADCDTPFSADMSAILRLNPPRDMGEAGTAAV